MDKLKQFLKWGLLSVILQCLVLFVFDKIIISYIGFKIIIKLKKNFII